MYYNIISLLALLVYGVLIFECNESNIATYIIGVMIFIIMRTIGYLECKNKKQLANKYTTTEFQLILTSDKYKIKYIDKYTYKINSAIYKYNQVDNYWYKSV